MTCTLGSYVFILSKTIIFWRHQRVLVQCKQSVTVFCFSHLTGNGLFLRSKKSFFAKHSSEKMNIRVLKYQVWHINVSIWDTVGGKMFIFALFTVEIFWTLGCKMAKTRKTLLIDQVFDFESFRQVFAWIRLLLANVEFTAVVIIRKRSTKSRIIVSNAFQNSWSDLLNQNVLRTSASPLCYTFWLKGRMYWNRLIPRLWPLFMKQDGRLPAASSAPFRLCNEGF